MHTDPCSICGIQVMEKDSLRLPLSLYGKEILTCPSCRGIINGFVRIMARLSGRRRQKKKECKG